MTNRKIVLVGSVAVLLVLLVGFLLWGDGKNALETERGQLGDRRAETVTIENKKYPIKSGMESMVVLAKEADGAGKAVPTDVHSAFLMLMNHERKTVTVVQLPLNIEVMDYDGKMPANGGKGTIRPLQELLTDEKAAGDMGKTARDMASKLLFGFPIAHYLAVDSEPVKQVLKQYPAPSSLLPAAWQNHVFFRLMALRGQPKSEMENILRALWPHIDTDVSKGGLINLITRIKAYDMEYKTMAFSKESLEINGHIEYDIDKQSLGDFVLEQLVDRGTNAP